jgi:UDP-2,3-diacylglucosamine pyrophosphatase LpxH
MNKTCFEKKINYKYSDVIKIKPIFDVHYGHTLCDVHAFKKFLEDSDDKTYFIGGGDFLDSIIVIDPRYRKTIDAFGGEEIIDDQVNGIYEILKPYKDRILGLGIGNHEDVIVRKYATNPIKRLCEKLNVGKEDKDKIPYLGYSYFYKLTMREKEGRGRTVLIKGHHGYGGGSRTQGADLTKFSKDMSYYDADVFIYGHTHKLQFDEVPRLGIAGNRLISKPKVLVICGSYKKSLSVDSTTTWEETMGFPPSRIGGATINIKPNGDWVDISVTL